eukprot:24292-Eustigmatos_ZCMA.PRE.1
MGVGLLTVFFSLVRLVPSFPCMSPGAVGYSVKPCRVWQLHLTCLATFRRPLLAKISVVSEKEPPHIQRFTLFKLQPEIRI